MKRSNRRDLTIKAQYTLLLGFFAMNIYVGYIVFNIQGRVSIEKNRSWYNYDRSELMKSPQLRSNQKQTLLNPKRILYRKKINDFQNYLNYSINLPFFCQDIENITLFVFIISAPPNFEERMAIRDTWGRLYDYPNSFKAAFLLGMTHNKTVQKAIDYEYALYNDLIQGSFIDSYYNLTYKTLLMLRWTSEFCPNAEFVLKADDDMFIHMKNLLIFIKKVKTSRRLPKNAMYGTLFKNIKPVRQTHSKYQITWEEFSGNIYPNYLSGTSYLISRPAIEYLITAASYVPFMYLEDVYITGLCAEFAEIPRINCQGFTFLKRPDDSCAFKNAITGHRVTPKNMKKIWEGLKYNTESCRGSHIV